MKSLVPARRRCYPNMCWAEKFCLFVPLNVGCISLSALNLILATCMAVVSIIHFSTDAVQNHIVARLPHDHTVSAFRLELGPVSVDIVFGVVLAVALSWIFFSLMLTLGIIRNKSSFILAYFFYGILLVILFVLSGLLVLLQGCWVLALIIFMGSVIYIHFSVAVYTVYELMLRGKDFRFQKQQDFDTALLNEDAEY